jgi:hypothetical protein
VRNRGAKRPVSGALRVDVDPLVIVSRFGEVIDAVLIDGQPLTNPEVLVAAAGQLAQGETDGHVCSSPFGQPRLPQLPCPQ